jgi:hypothetical protein
MDYYKLFMFNKSYILRDELIKNKSIFNLKAGGFEKKYSINYNGVIYYYERADFDKNSFILKSPNQEDNCVLISIISKRKIAQIENINGDYENCITFSNEKIGTFLLNLTLTFLKKYKNEFSIEWILISDHSKKKCGNKFFKLMKLSMLTDGNTWYGKYDFFPVNDSKELKYDKNGLKKYYYNQTIMNTKKLKDIKFDKYFIKIGKKFPEINSFIDTFLNNIKSNSDKLIKDYLKEFMADYNNCKYIYVIYEDLFDELKLQELPTLFGLKI